MSNLAPHQETFVKWMAHQWTIDLHKGIVLADPPSAGKTRSAMAAIQSRWASGAVPKANQRCLSICPSGKEADWIHEAKLVAPLLAPERAVCLAHVNASKRDDALETRAPKWILTSVATLWSEFKTCSEWRDDDDDKADESEHGPRLTAAQRDQRYVYRMHFDVVTVDEPQFLFGAFWKDKYKVTQRRACFELNRTACIVLNGTVVYNNEMDMVGQVYMLDQKPFTTREWWKAHAHDKSETVVKECVYRSESMFALGCQLVVEQETFELSDLQRQEINRIQGQSTTARWEWLDDTTDEKKSPSLMKNIVPILDICISPHLHDPTLPIETCLESSPRLHYMVETLLPRILTVTHVDHQQVVVFSRLHRSLVLLSRVLRWRWPDRFATDILHVDGTQSTAEQQRRFHLFCDKAKAHDMRTKSWSHRILMMTFQKGKTGWNLPQARHVVFADPSWNPNTDAQAVQRCLRKGQTSPTVTLYRLVYNHSAEHWILSRHHDKLHLSDKLGLAPDLDTSAPDGEETVQGEWWDKEGLSSFLFRDRTVESASFTTKEITLTTTATTPRAVTTVPPLLTPPSPPFPPSLPPPSATQTISSQPTSHRIRPWSFQLL